MKKQTGKDKTYIYLVRHGEVKNPKKIFYGRLPFHPLSEEGRSQIKKTAEYLLDEQIDILYSSPLLRARQSAEILKRQLGLKKVHFTRMILEVDSPLQGRPESVLESINFDFYDAVDNGAVGETLEKLLARMEKFIKKIIKKYQGKKITVVTHGDPIMVVRAKARGFPLNIKSIRQEGDFIPLGGVYLLKI